MIKSRPGAANTGTAIQAPHNNHEAGDYCTLLFYHMMGMVAR